MAESARLELARPTWDLPVFEAGAVATVPTLRNGGCWLSRTTILAERRYSKPVVVHTTAASKLADRAGLEPATPYGALAFQASAVAAVPPIQRLGVPALPESNAPSLGLRPDPACYP